MAKFSQQQLRQSLDFLHELYAWRDQEAFCQLPASLLTLIQGDVCSYNDLNSTTQKVTYTYAPLSFPVLPNGEEIVSQCAQGVEGRKQFEFMSQSNTPFRGSDLWSSSQFHRLPIYNEFYRPQRIPYVLITTLTFDRSKQSLAALHRNSRDFSEEERDLLELVRPHLAQAQSNAEHVSHLQHHLHSVNGAVEALNQGVVVLSSKGQIEWITMVGHNILKTFWPDWKQRKDSLPTLLSNWIHSQLQILDDPDYAPGVQMTLALNKGDYRLMLRLVPQGNQHVLFLEKEPIDLPLEHLALHGLTMREMDVLGWAIKGKSNPEISQILGTSTLTIQKQFGSIYQKLSVENRTAAVATALQIMRLAY